MKIQLTKSVKISGSWRNPGSVVEIDNKEANRLLVLKACIELSDVLVADLPTDEEVEDSFNELETIDGVSTELAEMLYEAGYKTVQQVAEADPEDLIRIKGIGKKNVEKIQDSAEELLEESDSEPDED